MWWERRSPRFARVPRLRRLPAQDRPRDPGRARGEEGLSGPAPPSSPVPPTASGRRPPAGCTARAGGSSWVVASPTRRGRVADELQDPGAPGRPPRGRAVHAVDFGRLDDVRALGDALAERHPRIDVLANNAGASFPRRTTTADGFETTFQVDHLAGYLLTRLLEQAAAGRARAGGDDVVVHAPHRPAAPHGHCDPAAPYSGCSPTHGPRTMNALFTRELARRWAPDVSATCYTPGAVATSFGPGRRVVRLPGSSGSPAASAPRPRARTPWCGWRRPSTAGATAASTPTAAPPPPCRGRPTTGVRGHCGSCPPMR